MSVYVPLAAQLYGLYLYFWGSDLEAFAGLLVIMGGTLVAAAGASFIRCRVCGHRVTLNAPWGHWWSYTTGLKECPECGDDGEGRPAVPGQLSVWQQAARDLAARERAARRARRRIVLRIAVVAAVLGVASWLVVRGGR